MSWKWMAISLGKKGCRRRSAMPAENGMDKTDHVCCEGKVWGACICGTIGIYLSFLG